MAIARRYPGDIAKRLGEKRDRQAPRVEASGRGDAWRRETFTLPRDEARETARSWFDRFPKAAYLTEIESWCELADGRIEFTIRRLPSAD